MHIFLILVSYSIKIKLWCSVCVRACVHECVCVSMLLCCPKPPECVPADEYEWVRPAHCQPITRSSLPPPSKSTSLSAVTQCYPRQPGKRLWRSNQLWLNTECDGSHYSKSGTAKALTTIDYLNIACIRSGGFRAHLRCDCLRREEVDCPPRLYWYCLSFMMTRTIFLIKVPRRVIISQFSLPCSFSRVFFSPSHQDIVRCFSWGSTNAKRVIRLLMFYLAFIVLLSSRFQVKHVRGDMSSGDRDAVVYYWNVLHIRCTYMVASCIVIGWRLNHSDGRDLTLTLHLTGHSRAS